jgi:hypothetical protein
MTTTNYCRFCGQGKGHTTSKCNNAREMRKAIANQDCVIKEFLDRADKAESEIEPLKKSLAEAKSQLSCATRYCNALLDLADANRYALSRCAAQPLPPKERELRKE